MAFSSNEQTNLTAFETWVVLPQSSPLREWDASSKTSSYLSRDFFLFKYKIENCMVKTAHDWKSCPFLHPNERARRRDLRVHYYEGVLCPNYRKERRCENGDRCAFAHGTFEFWLHPSNFRTQFCTSGAFCRRKFCFFSHSIEEFWAAGSNSRLLLKRLDGMQSEELRFGRLLPQGFDGMENLKFIRMLSNHLNCTRCGSYSPKGITPSFQFDSIVFNLVHQRKESRIPDPILSPGINSSRSKPGNISNYNPIIFHDEHKIEGISLRNQINSQNMIKEYKLF